MPLCHKSLTGISSLMNSDVAWHYLPCSMICEEREHRWSESSTLAFGLIWVLCFWICILYALYLLIVQDQEIRIDTKHVWALWAACSCVLKEWWDQEPLSGSCSGHGTHLLQWQPWFQSFWRQAGAPGHLPALHLLLPSLLSSLYCPFASFLQIPERSKR